MALFAAVVLAGCSKVGDVELAPAYESASARLHLSAPGSFRVDFRSGSGWEGFGALEGDTTRFGDKLWLIPKTLSGKSEEEISAQAMRNAQQLGKQTDLMAVRVLMAKVELSVAQDGKRLRVVEPPASDPDKHPLAGVEFSAAR